MPQLYCRPHVKTITPDMRFVVRTHLGVNTGARKFARGEEFPASALPWPWVKLIYEQMKIDLMPEPAAGLPAQADVPAADDGGNPEEVVPQAPPAKKFVPPFASKKGKR